MSTAESSFDEEVPNSEFEYMPGSSAVAIKTAAAKYTNKPISRNKLKLFIRLAKLEEESTNVNISIKCIQRCDYTILN